MLSMFTKNKQDNTQLKQQLLAKYIEDRGHREWIDRKVLVDYTNVHLDRVSDDLDKYIECINKGFSRSTARKNLTFEIYDSHSDRTLEFNRKTIDIGFIIKVTEQTPMGSSISKWVNTKSISYSDKRRIETLECSGYKIKFYISEFAPLVIK